MNPEKKKELAEHDERWSFEKTVDYPMDDIFDAKKVSWQEVRQRHNYIQEEHGDLYMEVSKKSEPTIREKVQMKIRSFKNDEQGELTFHHSQVYKWYKQLAYSLDITIGEAVKKTLNDLDEVREKFDLGKTVNVHIHDLEQMDKSESKVSKDELMEMIEEEQEDDGEDENSRGMMSDNENLDTFKDNDLPKKDAGDKES